MDDPEGIMITGIYYLAKEAQESRRVSPLYRTIEAADPTDCFLAIVSSIIGIVDAKNMWKSLSAGVQPKLVFQAVKLMARRMAWGITIGIAIYELGSCLDIWPDTDFEDLEDEDFDYSFLDEDV